MKLSWSYVLGHGLNKLTYVFIFVVFLDEIFFSVLPFNFVFFDIWASLFYSIFIRMYLVGWLWLRSFFFLIWFFLQFYFSTVDLLKIELWIYYFGNKLWIFFILLCMSYHILIWFLFCYQILRGYLSIILIIVYFFSWYTYSSIYFLLLPIFVIILLN